jgi:hypothetical protein
MPSDLIRGWKPVRFKKPRQIKNLEPRSDSNGSENGSRKLAPVRRNQPSDSGRRPLARNFARVALSQAAGSLPAAIPNDFVNKISWRPPSGLTLPVDSSHKTGTGEVAEWLKAALC